MFDHGLYSNLLRFLSSVSFVCLGVVAVQRETEVERIDMVCNYFGVTDRLRMGSLASAELLLGEAEYANWNKRVAVYTKNGHFVVLRFLCDDSWVPLASKPAK